MKIALGIVLMTLLYLFGMGKLENIRLRDLSKFAKTTVVSSVSSKSVDKSEVISKVSVNISGAVNKPGAYKVELYKTLGEAIEKAGGLKEDVADDQCYDLNYPIDGTTLDFYIAPKTPQKKVSINSGDVEALSTLPGIGPKTAAKIIDYRQANDRFKCLDDLKKVKGIKKSIFDAIKDSISLA